MPSATIQFDEERWARIIKQSLWYLELWDFLKDAREQLGEGSDQFVKLRRQVRKYFEHQLQAGNVALASKGPDLDKERQPIDTIVIHHTSGEPGYTLPYMESVQLLNIYVRHYVDKHSKEERGLKNQAIWSGHFRKGKQTFLAYHWLMRMDGSFERLLNDDQIGWHAGNWEINKRSIAICLDNDYEKQDPTIEILQKLAVHIKQHYPEIQKSRVFGHCEARAGTICPGTNFLDGWKADLLSYINDAQRS
jgi:hypothetical protein